jgi:hypothetical protein
MCNGGKVCLVGEHPDIAPSQFVICVMKSSYKDVIYQVYKENWGKQMLKHSEGKLCSYSKFKTYFGLEKYLCILKSF